MGLPSISLDVVDYIGEAVWSDVKVKVMGSWPVLPVPVNGEPIACGREPGSHPLLTPVRSAKRSFIAASSGSVTGSRWLRFPSPVPP